MASILIVDDRSVNRQYLVTLLGYFQHSIREAGDGTQALDLARAERPDLVITDILMPGMDGFDLVRQMRGDPYLEAVPVIFYSATYLVPEVQQLARDCGVKHILSKPAEPEAVLAAIADALCNEWPIGSIEPAPFVRAGIRSEFITERFLKTVSSLEVVTLRLNAIIELALELSTEREPAHLLNKFCLAAQQIVGAGQAAVAIIDGSNWDLLQWSVQGFETAAENAFRRAAERNRLFGEILALQPALCLDGQDVDLEALGLPAELAPTHSLLVVPLQFRGHTYGWLYLGNKLGNGPFNDEDSRIAQTLGALAAATYDSAFLYSEVRERTGKLFLEVEERREVEAELRSREAQLADLTANHPGIVFRQVLAGDTGLRFTFVSERAYEISGYAPREFIDDPDLFENRLLPLDRAAFVGLVKWSADELKSMDHVFQFRTRNDEEKWGRYVSTPRRMPNGDTIWDGLILDITEHKQLHLQRQALETQLQQSQKLEAVGTLTGGMAHDFNNLLLVIMGNLALLAHRVSDNPLNSKLAAAAAEAAERGAELIRRLLAFSRRQPLEPLPLDMDELVRAMMRLLSQTLGEQIEITVNVAPDLWLGFADPSQVESALANLAVNARDAMPKGGTLTVNVRNATLGPHDTAAKGDVPYGDFVLLEVSDTGTGMSDDTKARAFEPFFTTKEQGKGTGLGLSMIYGFAKQSGGHVGLVSEEGKGTSVQLYVPRAKAGALRQDAARPAISPPLGRGEFVLVVDDKEKVRWTVAALLKDLGYHVVEASPEHALDLFKGGTRIDVLFTDVVMPGMSGPELARRGISNRPDLKVLFTSGFPDVMNAKGDKVPANNRVLLKPYGRSSLASRMREILDAPGANHL